MGNWPAFLIEGNDFAVKGLPVGQDNPGEGNAFVLSHIAAIN